MKDRLVELLAPQLGEQVAEIVAVRLLANGILAPPCSVGDTAYMLTDGGAIRNLTVTKIDVSLRKNNVSILCSAVYDYYGDGTPCHIQIIPEKIGELYFFSRDDAEKAAKERSKPLSDRLAAAAERSAARGVPDGKGINEIVKE